MLFGMGLTRTLLLRASRNAWLREQLPQYRFAQAAVKRFMPGEDAGAALQAAKECQQLGLGALLTYLGENVDDAAEAQRVADHYAGVYDQIRDASLNSEISIKLTQLGHDIDAEVSFRHARALAKKAQALGNFLWIDMEDSSYVDSTLALYKRVRAEHDNVGVCLQSYLYRTPADLESLIPLKPAIRLVKGAYKEPPDRAYPRKKDVDAAYLSLAGALMKAVTSNGTRAAFATHDPKIVERLVRTAAEKGMGKDQFEFQMLYGIRSEAISALARSGHRGRVLISYGPAWYPWYMRRLAERPANVLFVLRNLVWS
jgi:proline dehydrogenase